MSLFYFGNHNLRNAHIEIDYDKEMVMEYARCASDPIYFIRTYVKIISLDKGLIPFELFDYQERFILAMHNNKRIISMQPRQMGKTQTVAAYILWYSIFNDEKTVAILANKAAAAREIMSRYQKMYQHLPMWIQQGVTTWNKGNIELENGSKVFTSATTGSAVTGRSVNFLYIDEAALIPSNVAEDFFTSAYPTLSSGTDTKIVLTSTPRGYNHFWKFWNEAEQVDPTNEELTLNGFVPIRIFYYEHPDRTTVEWAAEQEVLLGKLKFRQEVLCDFLGSSLTLIDSTTLSQLSAEPYEYSKENLDIINKPVNGNMYVVVADTSKGVGGDYSALTVIDITQTPYKVVAKFRDNNISPLLYPSVIYNIAKQYNNAFVLLEINVSEQVAYILHHELEYENILTVARNKMGQYVSSGFGGAKTVLGVNTDTKVKRIGCLNLKTLIEEKKLLVTDRDIISEISTFIEVKNSYEADENYHDDLIMTLVLFAWLTTNDYFKQMTDVNLRHILYDTHMKRIEAELAPIGFYDNGLKEEENKPFVQDGDYWVFDKNYESHTLFD